MSSQGTGSDQGTEYAEFIRAELDREYARRDVVNSRAATAISSATGLVTLVVAAAALVKGQGHTFHGFAAFWLVVAVVALLGAGVMAILAGVSWKFTVADESTLRAMAEGRWGDTVVDARNTVAKANIKTITTLRSGNNTKTTRLLVAYGLQTGAIAALAGVLITVVA